MSSIGEQYDRLKRGDFLRYHIIVSERTVWDFERQTMEWVFPDEARWEFVCGFEHEPEARTEMDRMEREYEQRRRAGDGTASELEFTVIDTKKVPA